MRFATRLRRNRERGKNLLASGTEQSRSRIKLSPIIGLALFLIFMWNLTMLYTTESMPQVYNMDQLLIKVNEINDSMCLPEMGEDWNHLCSFNFVKRAAQLILEREQINIVQIGAHTGFERNDPVAKGMTGLLDALVRITGSDELRKRVHWTFVEPSPPNFKRLSENLMIHSDMCEMKGINAAVVSDRAVVNNETKADNLIFYTIRDTIDPETGFDSLSNKTLPVWVTQLSSFSKDPILFNRRVFKKQRLSVEDYIVEVKVTARTYSDVMKEAVSVAKQKNTTPPSPLLVLIDTEGFDCDIVQGISPSSPYLPEYLLFEHKQCKKIPAYIHLKSMGYHTRTTSDNTVASKAISHN